jgi:hypothetical protein
MRRKAQTTVPTEGILRFCTCGKPAFVGVSDPANPWPCRRCFLLARGKTYEPDEEEIENERANTDA